LGWMRMMGADSFEDHRARVLGRGDDHPGMAMEYYMERVISGQKSVAGLGVIGRAEDMHRVLDAERAVSACRGLAK
jgi:hypothetical protein